MNEQLLGELVKYGGGTAIIVAILFLLKTVLPFFGIKGKGRDKDGDLGRQLDLMMGNHMAHFQASLDTLVEYAKKENERSEKMLMAMTDLAATLRERR